MNWSSETSDPFEIDLVQTLEERSVHMDVSQSGKSPLEFGEETIFVNAAIMNKKYRPTNAPWIIDLDLPLSS